MKMIDRRVDVVKTFNKRLNQCVSPKLSGFQRLVAFVDFYTEVKLFGASMSNYFEYNYYWKNHKGRKSFANYSKSELLYNTCNPLEMRYITGDKYQFNTRFEKYLNREWMDVSKSSYDEFKHFLEKHRKLFAKPSRGECGVGAQIVSVDETSNSKELYDKFYQEGIILEELISQHSVFSKLNPSSVNTIRIVTYRNKTEEIIILGAAFRIGRTGKVVDNFHNGGMVAALDIQTGIVSSTAVDAQNNRFIVHPDTNTPIIGTQIPCWDVVLKTVIDAARELKELRYIGWDVVVGAQNEIYIVEANSTPDTDLMQAPDQIGKWDYYYATVIADQK